jgi:hypothetical protein
MCDVGEMEGLVEAGVFYGGSDDCAPCIGAGCARDYIDAGGSNDEVKWERGRQGDSEHLSFFRCDLKGGQAGGDGGPGSGAIYKLFCVEDAGGCLDLDGVVNGTSGEGGCVGAEVDGGGMYGGEKCGGELAGVEAVLFEENETVVAGVEYGKEPGEVGGCEFVV